MMAARQAGEIVWHRAADQVNHDDPGDRDADPLDADDSGQQVAGRAPWVLRDGPFEASSPVRLRQA
jgi:hypothetical protein